MPTDALTIVGAGGHARVVYDAVRLASPDCEIEVRDDNVELNGRPFLDARVLAPAGPAAAFATRVHVAIGNNRRRREWCSTLANSGKSLRTVIHPTAVVSPFARIGDGTFVAANGVVGPGAEVGAGCIINHGAVVDHDCVVGPCAHVAPNAALGGGVRIGEGVLVGAGAVVLPGLAIGDWAVIGAGAVIIGNVPSRETVVGVPARIVRDEEHRKADRS